MSEEKWQRGVARDSQRLEEGERGRRSVLAQTVFLGTLSVLFVVPLLIGAYLGNWLDSRNEGYSVSWTLNLILLGLAEGIFNVYFFVRKHW